MASGVPGRGEILNVQITGSSVQVGGAPPQQVCVFQSMVYLDDTPPFQAEVRKRVPVYALANLQPGQSVVTVRVDPSDHTRVGIAFSAESPVVRLAKSTLRLTVALALGLRAWRPVASAGPVRRPAEGGQDPAER